LKERRADGFVLINIGLLQCKQKVRQYLLLYERLSAYTVATLAYVVVFHLVVGYKLCQASGLA
jgi:hypothetical protein